MFAVFPVMRQLHELLWYLTEALALPRRPPRSTASCAPRSTRPNASPAGAPRSSLALDVAAHRQEVNVLLLRASELVRAGARAEEDRRGADLIGAKLRGADLRGPTCAAPT